MNHETKESTRADGAACATGSGGPTDQDVSWRAHPRGLEVQEEGLGRTHVPNRSGPICLKGNNSSTGSRGGEAGAGGPQGVSSQSSQR